MALRDLIPQACSARQTEISPPHPDNLASGGNNNIAYHPSGFGLLVCISERATQHYTVEQPAVSLPDTIGSVGLETHLRSRYECTLGVEAFLKKTRMPPKLDLFAWISAVCNRCLFLKNSSMPPAKCELEILKDGDQGGLKGRDGILEPLWRGSFTDSLAKGNSTGRSRFLSHYSLNTPEAMTASSTARIWGAKPK